MRSSPSVTVALSCNDDLRKSLPTYDDAIDVWDALPKETQDECLEGLREVVDKYSMNDKVGIDIKHKHDDMAPELRLVETCDAEGKVSIMRPEKPDGAVPFAFVYHGKEWAPYEFVKDCAVAQDNLNAVVCSGGFMTEIAEVLTRYGMQNILGVHILHRNHLGGEACGTVETPGAADGELLLRPYTKEMKAELDSTSRQVMWVWSAHGKPWTHLCVGCSHSCGAHCNGHSKR